MSSFPEIHIRAQALHGLQLQRAPQVLGIGTARRQPESKPKIIINK
jgi:hypothetical protein